MANRAFFIPLRNDLGGLNLQIVELTPNTSQKNSVYDGEGQSGYIHFMSDAPGETVVSGNSYVSGSRTTSPLADTDEDGFTFTTAAEFGLLAYLRERVHVNPGDDTDYLTSGEAEDIVSDILSRVMAGSSLTASDINSIINSNVSGNDSDLTGDAAGSSSFGSVEDILRILSGETYLVKAGTILADDGGEFMDLATRLENADDVDYFAQGSFVGAGEAGYQAVRPLAMTGAVRGSVHEGRLSHLVGDNTLTILNPSFAYTASAVTSWKPRAVQIDGSNIPSTGTATVLRVYDSSGNVLS